MSLEHARGKAIDARSNIFSLGVMLYEMIAGRLPFGGGTPADVLGAILYLEPTPVDSVSSVPGTLARVVGRAISKRPGARYQTMDGLVADLKAVRGRSSAARSASQVLCRRIRPYPVRRTRLRQAGSLRA